MRIELRLCLKLLGWFFLISFGLLLLFLVISSIDNLQSRHFTFFFEQFAWLLNRSYLLIFILSFSVFLYSLKARGELEALLISGWSFTKLKQLVFVVSVVLGGAQFALLSSFSNAKHSKAWVVEGRTFHHQASGQTWPLNQPEGQGEDGLKWVNDPNDALNTLEYHAVIETMALPISVLLLFGLRKKAWHQIGVATFWGMCWVLSTTIFIENHHSGLVSAEWLLFVGPLSWSPLIIKQGYEYGRSSMSG